MDKLLAVANAEEGYQEGSNNYTKYGVWYGMSNASWCAMFVSWCADKAGISTDIIPKHSMCSDGVNWFQSRGLWNSASSYTPKPGDIIYFHRGSDIYHVGIVKSVSGLMVTTIKGNTSDMVAERSYTLNDSRI